MTLQNLDKQVWYWGKEDKDDANRALEHCLDGTYLVRQSSNPPDQTIHVVFKGVVKLVRILVRDEGVGLSLDNLRFKSVVEVIEHFSHVSLAQHNKALNVRLTNPLPKDPEDDSFEVMLKEDETWAIYVNFYMESEIRMAKEEKCLQELALAQEEAQRLSYQATAQHMVVEMLKEQLEIQPMARKHFSNEFLHFINNNFDTMRERLKKAEEKLEVCSDEVTKIQAKVRELVLLKDDMDKRKTRLYRKMDWYERLLPIEGIDNDTISNGIAPFTQNLRPKILIKGIKEMWFVGEMNSIDADKLLKGCDNGTFLVRLNNNRNYVLSVVNKRKVRHIRIHENEERHLCWLKTTKQFYSIELLVQFFQENSLGLQDREYTTKLMYPVYYK